MIADKMVFDGHTYSIWCGQDNFAAMMNTALELAISGRRFICISAFDRSRSADERIMHIIYVEDEEPK